MENMRLGTNLALFPRHKEIPAVSRSGSNAHQNGLSVHSEARFGNSPPLPLIPVHVHD